MVKRTPLEEANIKLTAIMNDAKERGETIVYSEMADRIEARHEARAKALVDDAAKEIAAIP